MDREKIVPHLKTSKEIFLYSTEGNVYTVFDFAVKFKEKLSTIEETIINENINYLNQKQQFKYPLTGTQEAYNRLLEPLKAKSIGSRSALLQKNNVKFKGCKFDISNQLCFPHEQLDFGDEKMQTTEIPFGVLTLENVLREILAFCFLKQFNININHTPINVFEYVYNKKIMGYCLVSKTKNEQRLESAENYYDLSISDLICLKYIEKKTNIPLTENEPDFGIDKEWYARQKAKLLIKVNFNGGFRGILNSNIGNDIIYKNKLYICDFDTFNVIKVPLKPEYEYIKNFTLWCIVEVLKTSPIILDYLDTEGLTNKEISEKLWGIYTSKSLLWKNYVRLFMKKVKDLNWNLSYIEESLKEIIQTQVFEEMILDNVINSKIIKNSYPTDLSFYTPH